MRETQTQHAPLIRQPVEVESPVSRLPVVVAIVVTWNRREMVARVLEALGPQRRRCAELHVVVIDNASTDGTADYLHERFRADRAVTNDTERALEPVFETATERESRKNALGVASLTIVRNSHNLGGCGGFNTGFLFVEHHFGAPGEPAAPDFVWLLDDDIDLPGGALSHLVAAAKGDPEIGLVGSRTVDLGDRRTTIESTIFYDSATGRMGPDPADEHPLAKGHAQWLDETTDSTGRRVYSGVREVDVVSACSLLARWSGVGAVGYWDDRFFIYCDDADWCLRFKATGQRVVCALDAVVYHTPWIHKLTPERNYYVNRNLPWMIRRTGQRRAVRRATLRWYVGLMREARSAILNRRLREADLILRALEDSIRGRGGKLGVGPRDERDVVDALVNATAKNRHVLLLCPTHDSILTAERFRSEVQCALRRRRLTREAPSWTVVAGEGTIVPAHAGESPTRGANRSEVVEYRRERMDKLRAQWRWLRSPPGACVVFDRANDFPLLRGSPTLHVGRDSILRCTVERDGLRVKAGFALRWLWTGVRALVHGMLVRPELSVPGRQR